MDSHINLAFPHELKLTKASLLVLHRETIETYRRMTPGQRLQLTLEMIRESTPYLFVGTPEEVDRRFELLRRENDARNRNMLEALARSVEPK